MRRVLVTTLMAGALAAPAISASAQQNNGGVGIRLLEAPTARQNDPRALRSIVDHVKPGASFSRKFEVSNTTSGRRRVAIYVAGADVVGGEFVPADGHTQNELSSWLTVDVASADLGAGQVVQPRLTVAVPASAPAGDRPAKAGDTLLVDLLDSDGEAQPDTVGSFAFTANLAMRPLFATITPSGNVTSASHFCFAIA